jgi:hypothetical protein
MPDPRPRTTPTAAPDQAGATPGAKSCAKPDAFLCDRCGAEMFRMHAVWRCPGCGFKTDCCGW